jgi:hypothetical protein
MKLFHAFPRRPRRTLPSGDDVRSPVSDPGSRKGLDILRSILTHGLLCTPEKFKLYPNYNTENKEKQQFLLNHQPHDEIIQSRSSFTLADALELSKEYELIQNQTRSYAAHTDLFGDFAIGLDPIEARALGIMPTVYYYRHDVETTFARTAGLAPQIIERLDEIRSLFSVLSYIEAKANPDAEDVFLPPGQLRSLGIHVKHQKDIELALSKIKRRHAAFIFQLLNTDRVPAWNLVDFIEILLSLYQTADSTIEDAPLAFFQQKEWRLVHHRMEGLRWVGLGNHPHYRDPLAKEYEATVEAMRGFIRSAFNEKSQGHLEWFLQNCWILLGTEEVHFRDFIREIVVPELFYDDAKAIVDSLPFIGDPPVITHLPPRWRITTGNGGPQIIRPIRK